MSLDFEAIPVNMNCEHMGDIRTSPFHPSVFGLEKNLSSKDMTTNMK